MIIIGVKICGITYFTIYYILGLKKSAYNTFVFTSQIFNTTKSKYIFRKVSLFLCSCLSFKELSQTKRFTNQELFVNTYGKILPPSPPLLSYLLPSLNHQRRSHHLRLRRWKLLPIYTQPTAKISQLSCLFYNASLGGICALALCRKRRLNLSSLHQERVWISFFFFWQQRVWISWHSA